ncbi:MAG: hypothetical protein PHG65_08725 [Kiritimatiellae bacterium]|nr:hypothetical protein [Kiritimatiellia bacterium]
MKMFGKSRGAWEARADELQQEYAGALRRDDLPTLIETSGELSIVYSAIGCKPLADRWMDEYLSVLERLDPGIKERIQTLRNILPN